jgi:phosphoglycolate phosphatase
MPVRRRNILLLDLDGTLVDPAVGIIGSVRYALQKMGAPVADDDDLRWIIGPPIRASFSRLLGGRGDIEAAVAAYRERYAAGGLFEAKPYPGMLDVLKARVGHGTRLILCTAKAKLFAQRVVDHFGFAPLLSAVYGAEMGGRFEDKADLIAHILSSEALDPGELCMVGDREHDARAASRHGIPTVGVLWGYGSREELVSAGAAIVIAQPSELLE